MKGWATARVTALLLGATIALLASPVYAHGFGPRYDLPLPLGLYLAGAGSAVAFSFIIVAVFLRGAPVAGSYNRIPLSSRPWLRYTLASPLFLWALRVASLALLALVVVAGLLGEQNPLYNIAPTLVWVVWWVGLSYISALVGDVWALLNPWKAGFELVEALFRWLRLGRPSLELPYPRRLGAWPALVLFLAFAWVENAYPGSARPFDLARMALAYSAITWLGMLLFGKWPWLHYGEAFTVAFGIFARFAPTEVRVRVRETCRDCPLGCGKEPACVGCYWCSERSRDVEVALRPYGAGLWSGGPVGWDRMAFVLTMLATVTFDGFKETPIWVRWVYLAQEALPFAGGRTHLLVDSAGVLGFPLALNSVYLLTAWAMHRASRAPFYLMARGFAYSLVPIALAYHIAHYFSFLLIQGQYIIPLASDPLGRGWDLLGTASYRVNIGVVDARAVWLVALLAIVGGHILAVYLGHLIALLGLGEASRALRSQFPMLALMVGYTVTSLWIVAQPIVG